MSFFHKDKSLRMSAPRAYTLHGVKISKLPIKKYIQVLSTFDDLPSVLVGKIFPDTDVSQILVKLKTLDKNGLLALVGRLLATVPDEALNAISELLDIPRDILDNMGLNELAEILIAFWEINDMTDFFANARRLMAGAKEQLTGSSGGLQSHKA